MLSTYSSPALVAIVFLPLLAAMVAGLGQRWVGVFAAKLITTGALFVGCALSWPLMLGFIGGGEASVTPVLTWVASGDFRFDWTLRLDALTAVMLVVVTTVSALVHLYSWGYMADDPSQPRFFAYLSLFSFAMLMLVTADNLVQMFFGWEGVGLASYLLIGFWYKKPSANAAAIKAFLVNRVGDFGFMLGIFGTFILFGSVSIPTILADVPRMAGVEMGFLGMRFDALTLLCLLLFLGAMGKSAQLGLHVWLPDAMEGPTPVSALIHAATMVTAGVFMVCRLSPMFEAAPFALAVIIVVGGATCLFAATIGTVQWDIKRVIAYSTCSQLGYMFFAAGVGAYSAAMFHLFTHAFFKALLFLGAGSVIHAMHHEQDMRYYGGLRKHIPWTFATMMIGTLAITGVGIVGVAGFAGFYSKDMILEAAFASGNSGVFWVGIFAALLTSFYSWRLMFLTFYGEARWNASEHIRHALADSKAKEYHPHESPWTILVPLAALSLGAVVAGGAFYNIFVDAEAGARFWSDSLAFDAALMQAAHHVPLWTKWSPFVVMIIGLALAWTCYLRRPELAAAFATRFRWLHRLLFNKYYVDEIYDFLFVRPTFALGRLLWKRGDEAVIDRFGPDGAVAAVQGAVRLAGRFQSGYVYGYAFVIILGLLGLMSWAMVRG